jgi:hypothetical protein
MILTAIKGDTTIFELTITDQDGVAVNLTGATVFLTVKTKPNDTDASAILKKDVTAHTDPTHGITRVILSNTEMNIAPGAYYYDIQVKSSAGLIQSIASDSFRVIQDITTRTS